MGSLLSFSLILFKLYDSFPHLIHLDNLHSSFFFLKKRLCLFVELGKYAPTDGAGSEKGEEETWNYRTHVSGFLFFFYTLNLRIIN